MVSEDDILFENIDPLGFYSRARTAALVEDDEMSAAEEGFVLGFIDECVL